MSVQQGRTCAAVCRFHGNNWQSLLEVADAVAVEDWGQDEEIFDWNTITGGQADGVWLAQPLAPIACLSGCNQDLETVANQFPPNRNSGTEVSRLTPD